jgi:hypothetical protein
VAIKKQQLISGISNSNVEVEKQVFLETATRMGLQQDSVPKHHPGAPKISRPPYNVTN